MGRVRICAGELIGCQPSWRELEDIWMLALNGIGSDNRESLLTHTVNGREIIREETLEKLLTEAGDPVILDNLSLKLVKHSPACSVEIEIGPGRVTFVSVEAEDHTWAIGRHSEIMERLLRTRKKYALGPSYIPQWPIRRKYSIGGVVRSFAQAIGSVVGALVLLILAYIYVNLIYGPIYQIITDYMHHEQVPHRFIILAPFSVTAAAAAVIVALMVAKACKSMVVVQSRPLWNSNRVTILTSATAVISALTGIVALLIN
jgi:hypothetical protein